MHVSLESPDQPDVAQLIEALDAYQVPLYPLESHHGVSIEALGAPDALFAVARDAGGRAVGCGAVVLKPGYGELKRMYTDPAQRGKGVARAVLAFLEARAADTGRREFKLETGNRQPDAIALYARCGYEPCGPFGDYMADPNSVFMHKSVA